MQYITSGVCSRSIDFEVEDGIITSCSFNGGCSGNTQGVAKLVTGMEVDKVISLLRGIRCGRNVTSCPDQLAQALEAYKNAE
ncbi:MAG: TIGR03905 family TSCPD domain-containing protein [Lachnospiraceae bacterium]|nr:TIGR03905 family TSCPD domain-containing protein [Lachnospiraceae bacterium]